MTVASFLTWLQEWAQVLGALGSIVLTIALVGLYYQQYRLYKWESNQDIRRRHTETLKERIRVWHGNIDEIDAETDPLGVDNTNLPTVKGASVEPAPGEIDLIGVEKDFRVVPAKIEDDRYLNDLLDNHADDLDALKEEIKQQHTDFTDLREEFTAEYETPDPIEENGFTVTTTKSFPAWLFESLLRIQRSSLETDTDDILGELEAAIDRTGSGRPNEGTIAFGGHPASGSTRYILRATLNSGDLSTLDAHKDVIEKASFRLGEQELRQFDDDSLSVKADRAGDILDEMAASINELQTTLVEYEGDIHYAGDCEFINESQF